MTIIEQKKRLRQAVREKIKLLSAHERRMASDAMCARIVHHPAWHKSTRVLLFAPLPDEINIWPLAELALAQGKQLALPRHNSIQDYYEVFGVEKLDKDLRDGYFGIREPNDGCNPVDITLLDLILVPGMAFSREGIRLGRGKGYYDRLLAGVPGWKCGVGYDCQTGWVIPAEPHDVRLNCIVSPSSWHEIAGWDAV